MRINHNIASLNTYRQLSMNTTNGSKSLEKLSSGLRINRAGDDAAGLAISEKMRGQIRGLDQAARNAQDGISMIQTAEGALNETHSILQRMRELAVQSANDTNTSTDREEIQKEIDQLAIEITRIANDTEFNTQKLVNGGISAGGLGENKFHIGANSDQALSISIGAMDAKTLGVSRDIVGATLADTAVDVTAASISGTTGAALIDGATVTITAAAVDGTEASGTFSATKLGIKALDTGNYADEAGNGIMVVIDASSGATVGAVLSGTTLTITLDSDDTMDADAVTAALAAGGLEDEFEVTAGDEVADNDTLTLLGGTADSFTVTFSNGSGATQDVTGLAGTEGTIAGTGAFAGLVLTTDGAFNASLSASITLANQQATAASFTGGVTTNAFTAAGIDVSSQTAANDAITVIEAAITTVSAERSKLGAYQNRLEHTINNLQTSSENLTASESRIRDVDMAKEMMEFTKNNILTQAAQAMLAQANQQPQGVLQLLR